MNAGGQNTPPVGGPQVWYNLEEGQPITNDSQAEREIFISLGKVAIIAEIENNPESAPYASTEINSISEEDLVTDGDGFKGNATVTFHKYKIGYFAHIKGTHFNDEDDVEEEEVKFFADLDEAQKWATEEAYRICA